MDKMSLIAYIFQSVPESIIILFFGLTMTNNVIKPKRVLLIAALSAASSVVVRQLPIQYGTHTLIGIAVITILLLIFYGINIKKSFYVALTGLSLLLIAEMFITPIILWIFGLTVQEVIKNEILRVLVPIPELVFMAGVTIFFSKYKTRKSARSTE